MNLPVSLHNALRPPLRPGRKHDGCPDAVHQGLRREELTQRAAPVKRAALYLRVSTVDQHPETQGYDLHQMAAQRGYEIRRSIPTGSAAQRRAGLVWMT